MSARIRSYRNGIDPIDETSRDDLEVGDFVTLTALDAASTYSWIIAFAPEGSAATFSGSASAISPGSFVVDLEGPYLIRLTVDAGLPTEDTQHVRLRALTAFGQLTLVAAGERRDDEGVIPVDVDVEGWANEQNANLQTLKNFIKPLVASGRILYVDANDGTQEYADHSTVQGAISAAETAGASAAEQWIVAVRPGTYVEDVAFRPFIHVLGWPGNPDGRTSTMVLIQGTHTAQTSLSGHQMLIANVHLENTSTGTAATLTKTGAGRTRVYRSRLSSSAVSVGQGPAALATGGTLSLDGCVLEQAAGNADDTPALATGGANVTLTTRECEIRGPSGVSLNETLSAGNTVNLATTIVEASGATGYGVLSSSQVLLVDRSVITSPGDPVTIHPSGGVLPGGIDASFRWSTIGGDLTFEITGVVGSTILTTSSCEMGAFVYPGGTPTTVQANLNSRTLFYDNTVSGLAAENVQDAIDELSFGASIAPVVYHQNMPEVPNDTVRYRGWAPVSSELIAVRVYMENVNTQGNYTLAVVNNATGNTVLSAATFDMNTLAAATPTTVPLTATVSDLSFSTLDRWTISLTSDDPAFDGDSVYVSLVFNTAAAGGPVVEDLATTLLVGNTTGGTNIEVTAGDIIQFGPSPLAPISAAGTGRLRYSQADTAFQVSVDGGPWEDIGGGGGSPFVHKNVPVLPNNTFRYEGWAPIDSVVGDISVAMATVNTQGNYTATFTNETTGFSMLVGASFDMNTLVAGTVTPLTLTGTVGDLTFAAGDQWSCEFTSDDLAFDGDGIYFSILFGTTGVISYTGAPDDAYQFQMLVSPGNTIEERFFAPYNLTIVEINAYCDSGAASAAGTYTLAVEDEDGSNNLLSAATFDMEAPNLPAATLTSIPLTGTTANLDLAKGTRVKITLASDNLDLVASGVYVQIIYRSQ